MVITIAVSSKPKLVTQIEPEILNVVEVSMG